MIDCARTHRCQPTAGPRSIVVRILRRAANRPSTAASRRSWSRQQRRAGNPVALGGAQRRGCCRCGPGGCSRCRLGCGNEPRHRRHRRLSWLFPGRGAPVRLRREQERCVHDCVRHRTRRTVSLAGRPSGPGRRFLIEYDQRANAGALRIQLHELDRTRESRGDLIGQVVCGFRRARAFGSPTTACAGWRCR